MRIALATVGTTGDVRPFAILAGRLVERGHELTADEDGAGAAVGLLERAAI